MPIAWPEVVPDQELDHPPPVAAGEASDGSATATELGDVDATDAKSSEVDAAAQESDGDAAATKEGDLGAAEEKAVIGVDRAAAAGAITGNEALDEAVL